MTKWITLGTISFEPFTTAQRNALVAQERMVIYNSTTGQFEIYISGAWHEFADYIGSVSAAEHEQIPTGDLHPEYVHAQQSELISGTWLLQSGGKIMPNPGDPPEGEVVVQVKTTTGAPTHSATRGTLCLVGPDTAVYFNATGSTTWTLLANSADLHSGNTLDAAYDQGGGGSGRIVTVDSGAIELRHSSNLTMLATRDAGDSVDRFALSRDGDMSWGSGAAAADIMLSRAAANRLAFAAGDILSVQYLADTAGNTRITTAAASPHVVISDDLQVAGVVGLKGSAIDQRVMVRIIPTMTVGSGWWYGVSIQPTLTVSTTGDVVRGVVGVPSLRPSTTVSSLTLQGLYFAGTITDQGMSSSTVGFTDATAIFASVSIVGIFAGNTFNVGTMRGLFLQLLITPVGATINVTNAKMIHMVPPSSATVTDFWGIHLEDETAATGINYLLEIGDRIVGPVTPYLRLLGGGNPAANQTNLYLKEAANLRHVQWKDGAAIGAGDRVMILV